MLCWLFYACNKHDVAELFIGVGVFLFVIGFFVLMGFVAYFEAKSKMPPLSGDDITKILDDAKRRAYERGRYE